MNKPYIQIDLAQIPEGFDLERLTTIFNKPYIQMVDVDIKHELEVVGGPLNVKIYKLLVDQSVIDFLDLHDVEYVGGNKYYKYNKLTYKYNGIK